MTGFYPPNASSPAPPSLLPLFIHSSLVTAGLRVTELMRRRGGGGEEERRCRDRNEGGLNKSVPLNGLIISFMWFGFSFRTVSYCVPRLQASGINQVKEKSKVRFRGQSWSIEKLYVAWEFFFFFLFRGNDRKFGLVFDGVIL